MEPVRTSVTELIQLQLHGFQAYTVDKKQTAFQKLSLIMICSKIYKIYMLVGNH